LNIRVDAEWKDVKYAFEKLSFDVIKVIQWETFVNTVINPQQLVQLLNNCQSVEFQKLEELLYQDRRCDADCVLSLAAAAITTTSCCSAAFVPSDIDFEIT
jgi:hypothetical protein